MWNGNGNFLFVLEFVTPEDVEKAKLDVFKKKGMELVNEIMFEKITEGKCVQVLHVGPYSTEPESLSKMRKLMEEKNFIEDGLHHEIYLSDPRKVTLEKMKTILRQPVKEKN